MIKEILNDVIDFNIFKNKNSYQKLIKLKEFLKIKNLQN